MPTISTAYKGDMLFETTLGNHTIQIDVPAAMGGADRGPTPPELFIASLGSCVGAFVANYCQQAGVDTRDLRVDVSFDKLSDPTRLANLAVKVTMPYGDCHGRERALLRVAEHCPVHETMVTLEGITIEVVGRTEATPVPA